MEPDGITLYSGQDLEIDDGGDWDSPTLKMLVTRPGWSDSIRIKCSTDADEVITDAFTYTQPKDPAYNCENMLELRQPILPDLALNYSIEPTFTTIEGGFSAFI